MLVFDEVKVVSRLMWIRNSRNQQIIGLAMSPDDMSSLHDIYMTYDEDTKTEQTSYVLQFCGETSHPNLISLGHSSLQVEVLRANLPLLVFLKQLNCFSCMGLKPRV